MSILNLLYQDTLMYIIQFLDIKSKMKLLMTSKQFYSYHEMFVHIAKEKLLYSILFKGIFKSSHRLFNFGVYDSRRMPNTQTSHKLSSKAPSYQMKQLIQMIITSPCPILFANKYKIQWKLRKYDKKINHLYLYFIDTTVKSHTKLENKHLTYQFCTYALNKIRYNVYAVYQYHMVEDFCYF